jgi:hypothetical protein
MCKLADVKLRFALIVGLCLLAEPAMAQLQRTCKDEVAEPAAARAKGDYQARITSSHGFQEQIANHRPPRPMIFVRAINPQLRWGEVPN